MAEKIVDTVINPNQSINYHGLYEDHNTFRCLLNIYVIYTFSVSMLLNVWQIGRHSTKVNVWQIGRHNKLVSV